MLESLKYLQFCGIMCSLSGSRTIAVRSLVRRTEESPGSRKQGGRRKAAPAKICAERQKLGGLVRATETMSVFLP